VDISKHKNGKPIYTTGSFAKASMTENLVFSLWKSIRISLEKLNISPSKGR